MKNQMLNYACESGFQFSVVIQSQSVVMQNQSKQLITFDTQLKTALIGGPLNISSEACFLDRNVWHVRHHCPCYYLPVDGKLSAF